MKALHKGIALAVVHLLIISSLGAKLIYDRATRPRVWVSTFSYDPETPLRGRYANLFIEVKAPPMSEKPQPSIDGKDKPPVLGQWLTYTNHRARLEVREGQLWVVNDPRGDVTYGYRQGPNGGDGALGEAVAFYIPEHALDPTIRKPGRELWAEVTVPRKGPPRPIRLAYKENGKLTPLDLR